MRTLTLTFLFIFTALFLNSGLAEDAPVVLQNGPTTKLLKVELIAFDQRSNSALTEEQWPVAPGEPDFTHSILLHDYDPTVPDSKNYSYAEPQNYDLNGMQSKLERKGFYHTLVHVTWIQPALSPKQAQTIHLTSVDQFEGNVTISQSRYPHIHSDFVLHNGNNSYRMIENSKLKLNKIQYLDHPLVGLLVKVSYIS